jgi:hypothetical protein
MAGTIDFDQEETPITQGITNIEDVVYTAKAHTTGGRDPRQHQRCDECSNRICRASGVIVLVTRL